jgi:pyrimidine and pyridine-specific 5'-nucleotidase
MAAVSRCLVLDVDDTLFPSSTGLLNQFLPINSEFVRQGLAAGDLPDDPHEIGQRYIAAHGNRVVGLLRDPRLNGVASVNAESYYQYLDTTMNYSCLSPCPALHTLLATHKLDTVSTALFSNGNRLHVERILQRLHLPLDLFSHVFTAEFGDIRTRFKPDPLPYAIVEAALGVRPDSIYFVDDSLVNCAHAHSRGWHVALVKEGTSVGVHASIDSISVEHMTVRIPMVNSCLDLPLIWPELFHDHDRPLAVAQ